MSRQSDVLDFLMWQDEKEAYCVNQTKQHCIFHFIFALCGTSAFCQMPLTFVDATFCSLVVNTLRLLSGVVHAKNGDSQ